MFFNFETNEWQEDRPVYRRGRGQGLQVIPDIEPYRNVIDGKVIGGRRQHREFLRRGDGNTPYIEVGNERVKQRPPELPSPAEAIRRAWAEQGFGD